MGRIEEGEEIDKKIIIFDFSGKQMYYKHIIRPLLKKINVFLFVYDCSSRESFDGLKERIKSVQREVGVQLKGAIISNKNDFHNQTVTKEDGMELARDSGLSFFQTSVEHPETVKTAFLSVIE